MNEFTLDGLETGLKGHCWRNKGAGLEKIGDLIGLEISSSVS
jgi:hypothetical protein